jgi:hypothetical protein
MAHQQEQEIIERVARIYEGNARAYLKKQDKRNRAEQITRDWSKEQILAASGFAISGSYWSLIDPRRAVSSYRRASELYRSMGHDFWMVLALASEPEAVIPPISLAAIENHFPSGLSLAFGMVCFSLSGEEQSVWHWEHLKKHWEGSAGIPIGRLRIPLDYYGRCAEGMRSARLKKDEEVFQKEAANYVNRAAEILRIASHDRFHWLRFQSAILPAEPEVIATIRAMSVISNSVFKKPITKMAQVDEHGQYLMAIGERLWKAARYPQRRKPRQ